jgi:hypothetical protein
LDSGTCDTPGGAGHLRPGATARRRLLKGAGLAGAVGVAGVLLQSNDASAQGSSGLVPTGVKTAAYTASPGDFVPCDTTTAAFTVTLPTAPADGSVIGVRMIDGGVNALTVASGSGDVFDVADGATTESLTLLYQGVICQYSATPKIWYITSEAFGLPELDQRYVQSSQMGTTSLVIPSSGMPASTAGMNGDIAVDYTTGEQWLKTGGTWGQSGLVFMGLLKSTGTSGFTLQDPAPTMPILTWTAPSDGNMHRVAAFLTMVYSAATGGQIKITLTDPGGTPRSTQLIAPLTAGSTGSSYASTPTCLIAAGSTFNLEQGTGLSAGSATIWAEIWGS